MPFLSMFRGKKEKTPEISNPVPTPETAMAISEMMKAQSKPASRPPVPQKPLPPIPQKAHPPVPQKPLPPIPEKAHPPVPQRPIPPIPGAEHPVVPQRRPPRVNVDKEYHPDESMKDKMSRHAHSFGRTLISPVRKFIEGEAAANTKFIEHKDSYDKLGKGGKALAILKHIPAWGLSKTDLGKKMAYGDITRSKMLEEAEGKVNTTMKKNNPNPLWQTDMDDYETREESPIPGLATAKRLWKQQKEDGKLKTIKDFGKEKFREAVSGFYQHDIQKGASQSLDMASSLAGVAGMANVPFAGAVSGGLSAASGAVSMRSALHQRSVMGDVLDENLLAQAMGQRINADRVKTARQARANASIDALKSGGQVLTGGLKALGKTFGTIATLGTGEAAVNAAVDTTSSVVGKVATGLGLGTGAIAKTGKKELRNNVLEEELDISAKADEMQKQMEQQGNPVTKKEARQLALKKAGFTSGKKREAFLSITMQRAYQLAQDAERPLDSATSEEDKHAIEESRKMLSDMGLSTGKDGKYSRQAIGEKLGIDSGKDWQQQLHMTRLNAKEASHKHNPFVDEPVPETKKVAAHK